MSTVYATESFGVGHDGGTLWVVAGDEYDTGHPVVQAMPDKFTAERPDDEPQPKRRGRRG